MKSGGDVSKNVRNWPCKNAARHLNTTDVVIVIFIVLLSIIGALFAGLVPYWRQLILINLGVIAYAFLVACLRHRTGYSLLRWLHDWNTIPLMIFCFKEVYFLIQPIYGGKVFDAVLIAADRWLLRADPTVWMAGFSHPYLTEILQAAYSLFYAFFLTIGYDCYRCEDKGQFSQLRFAIAYGFILSYIGYLLFPAVGPRFTLHSYPQINTELPGVILTPYLRWFVDAGDSIPAGASNAVAGALAQRDAFPSGHTMMTLVLIALGFRWRVRSRFFLLAVGSLLIVATVYLRYHYVVDVLAGALFALLCLQTSNRLGVLLGARFGVDP